MMIRGRYDQERRPRLTARVSLSETGVESNVEFLVSTGSPRSFLNQEDAERLGWKQGGRKYGQKLVWAGQTSPGRLTKALVVLTQEDRTEIRLIPGPGNSRTRPLPRRAPLGARHRPPPRVQNDDEPERRHSRTAPQPGTPE